MYTRLGVLTTIHVTYINKERLYTINTLYSTRMIRESCLWMVRKDLWLTLLFRINKFCRVQSIFAKMYKVELAVINDVQELI